MDQISSEYERLRHDGGAFRLSDYSIVEFSGTEWKDWLQGQVTNDVRLLSQSRPLALCLCKPTGQILAPGHLHELEDKGWLIIPTACVESVLQRVEQMVILEDCEAHRLEATLYHDLFAESGLQAKRTLWPGVDCTTPPSSEPLSNELFQLATLEAGIPLWGIDMSDSNFPAEMGEDFESQTMSYTKGCYTGQEVNHRIHSRGHTNKTWGVYRAESELSVGQELLGADGAKIGTVTRCQFHPEAGWLFGAFVKNGSTIDYLAYEP